MTHEPSRDCEDFRARLIAEVEAAWDDTCAGNKNIKVCESCRAYADVLSILRSAT